MNPNDSRSVTQAIDDFHRNQILHDADSPRNAETSPTRETDRIETDRPITLGTLIPVSASSQSLAQDFGSGVLTVQEVALELRCSKAHVHNLVNGKVHGAQPLPALRLGRRRLVRRASLEKWIEANEGCYDPIIARH
jgi:excisionase family DNA binding protein